MAVVDVELVAVKMVSVANFGRRNGGLQRLVVDFLLACFAAFCY